MKKLIFIVLLAGCVGSTTPRNPMERPAPKSEAWWRATTVGVEDNPWEIYVAPLKLDRWDDPWSTYKGPAIFPEDFKDRVDGREERPTITEEHNGEVY